MTSSLAFIGLGPSNTKLFIELARSTRDLESFSESPLPQKRIFLIDHEENHGTGKPWGRHAHPSMLLSHKVGEFKDGFIEWLYAKPDFWLTQLEPHREKALKTWFAVNQDNLDSGNYGEIHMPRFIYGLFAREQLCEALKNLPDSLKVTLIDGKVTDIDKEDDGYRLKFQNPAQEIVITEEGEIQAKPGERKFINALSVNANVIGVGTPEPKVFNQVKNNPDYFHNPTERHPYLSGENFAEQFKKAVLKKYEQTGNKVKIGAIGAGLSFLDLVNVIYNDSELKKVVDLTAISLRGLARTEKEAKGKPADMASESQIALEGLRPKFIAAKVENLQPGEHGSGICVKTSNRHLDEPGYDFRKDARSDQADHTFDIVVQALGYGPWQEIPVFAKGLEKGIFGKNEKGWLAVDENMQIAKHSFVNGFITAGAIRRAANLPLEENVRNVNNFQVHSAIFAQKLIQELFGSEIEKLKAALGHGKMTELPIVEGFEQKKPKRAIS